MIAAISDVSVFVVFALFSVFVVFALFSVFVVFTCVAINVAIILLFAANSVLAACDFDLIEKVKWIS